MRLGSQVDDANFRKQIQEKITKTTGIMKKLQLELDEFKTLQVSYDKEVRIHSHQLFIIEITRLQV